jgi:ankyrin repeat protein
MMHAARGGHVLTVRLLLGAGARIDARDKHAPGEPAGRTALHYAARRRDLEVAGELLAAGAPLNAVGTGSVGTPLDDAIYGDDRAGPGTPRVGKGIRREEPEAGEAERALAFVQFLLSQGADPNVPDAHGNAPLHGAASRGLAGVAAALLDGGADVNCRNATGWTAFAFTTRRKHVDVAALLLRRGLDVALKDNSGWNALHWAIPTGSVELVRAVLDRGAPLNERDEDGRTPFDLAVENRQPVITELLTKAGARSGRAR